MQIDIQIKTITARLLANENIQIEFGQYPTAFFDVMDRILGMPMWGVQDADMADMLIGHEVSHALHTPPEGWHDVGTRIPGCPKSYVNIIEDIRIERLILRKYPGLLAAFLRGYTKIKELDIFKIKGRDIRSFGFMDRLNISAKFRTLIDVPFSEEEEYYRDLAMNVETWDDVVNATRIIYEWLKKRNEQEPKTAYQQGRGKGTGEKIDGQPGGRGSDGDPEGSGDGQGKGDSDLKACPNGDLTSVETDNAQRQHEAEQSMTSTAPSVYNAPDAADIDKMMYPYEDLKESRLSHRAARYRSGMYDNPNTPPTSEEYKAFMQSIKPRVNALVREFEMRKSAYRTKRARMSSTGKLDVSQLHKYKYDDQLFAQAMTLADAQNHGMMMLVDFSISMSGIIDATLKQILVLMEFCRRVKIPFEVWSFTSPSDGSGGSMGVKSRAIERNSYKPTGHVSMKGTQLVQLVRSNLKKMDYEEACQGMFNRNAFQSPLLGMHMTPLATSVLAMDRMCSRFKEKHKLDKMNLIVLTDGAGSGISFADGKAKHAQARGGRKAMRIDGKYIDMSGTPSAQLKAINNHIRSKGTKLVNIHLLESETSVGQYVTNILDEETVEKPVKALVNEFQKDGMTVFDDVAGYDRIILADARGSFDTTERRLEVDTESADRVAKEYGMLQQQKKRSRLIATKFTEMIA